MSFRTRLVLLFTLAVGIVSVLVSAGTVEIARRAFERVDQERTRGIAAQFRREFVWQSREVTRRVDAMAASESLARLATEMVRPGADPGPYLEQAATLAREQDLEIVEIIGPDGTIISSAHNPAGFGRRQEWVAQPSINWRSLGAFVEIEEFPDGNALSLLAVRPVTGAEGGQVFLVGGQRLDKEFLDSLATPPGMTAVLSRAIDSPSARRSASATAENVHVIPLRGRSGQLLGVLELASTRDEVRSLTLFIRLVGLVGAVAGIGLGFAFAWWAASRVTRPVQELATGAREVAAGNWSAAVPVNSADEIGELGNAFNQMTRQLVEQRDRLVQVERVAAWRELARRLAHELKNPLFPLQITVENLQRARDQHPAQFDEVFRESTATLLAELSQLKSIIGRFSDFAKMPTPRAERIELAAFLPPLLKLFEPQWQAPGQPPIEGRLAPVDQSVAVVADPDHLARALRNLILNAMDALPQGGRIDVRAARSGDGEVTIEVADTGAGLTREECERIFTPYYTTKQHGTGLGLAIVQAVVSDHGGRIGVDSEPGKGTTFRITLAAAGPSGT